MRGEFSSYFGHETPFDIHRQRHPRAELRLTHLSPYPEKIPQDRQLVDCDHGLPQMLWMFLLFVDLHT